MIAFATTLALTLSVFARDADVPRLSAADLCTVTVTDAALVECVDRDGSIVYRANWRATVPQFTARLLAAQFRLKGRDTNPQRFYFQR